MGAACSCLGGGAAPADGELRRTSKRIKHGESAAAVPAALLPTPAKKADTAEHRDSIPAVHAEATVDEQRASDEAGSAPLPALDAADVHPTVGELAGGAETSGEPGAQDGTPAEGGGGEPLATPPPAKGPRPAGVPESPLAAALAPFGASPNLTPKYKLGRPQRVPAPSGAPALGDSEPPAPGGGEPPALGGGELPAPARAGGSATPSGARRVPAGGGGSPTKKRERPGSAADTMSAPAIAPPLAQAGASAGAGGFQTRVTPALDLRAPAHRRAGLFGEAPPLPAKKRRTPSKPAPAGAASAAAGGAAGAPGR